MSEKITEFINENKLLTEINKNYQTDLKSLQTSMTNAKKDAEYCKEHYKMLQIKNKDVLNKIENTNKLTNDNDVANSEELPTKYENNFCNRSYISSKALLLIFDLTTIY